MIAPMLGMKARTPVTRPEQPRHRHAAERQHEPGEDAFEDHRDQAAEQQPAKREADMLGDPVEAGAVRAAAASRRCRGRRSAAPAARKMPMTIIAMTLATAPIDASDRARQTADRAEQLRCRDRPTALGHEAQRGGEGHQPVELRGDDVAQALRTARRWSFPANQKTQPMKPKPRIRTSSSRQPRGIGR